MVKKTTSNKELRQFGIIFGNGLIVIFGLLFPWIGDRSWPLWPWITGGMFAIVALIFSRGLLPFYILWMKIGGVLGWINTRIILAAIFFLLIFPFALVMRILGKDPMRRKLDAKSDSYRISSIQQKREQLEKPF